MKCVIKIILFLIFINQFLFVFAQEKSLSNIDSVALASRNSAEIVLDSFKKIETPKLLFSIQDKYYYILIKNNNCYHEYFACLTNCNVVDTLRVFDLEKNNNHLIQKKLYKKILNSAEPIFDYERYHSGYITSVTNATCLSGQYCYFVIKDLNGNRYGEFRLPILTFPSPINWNLLLYLIRRLSEQIGFKDESNLILKD